MPYVYAGALPFLAVATYTDIKERKVRNRLTVPMFIAGVAVACSLNGSTGVIQSLKGAGFCFLLILVLPLRAGGGDIKLMTACGAWLGWPLAQNFFGWTVMLTAIAAIVWAVKTLGIKGLLSRLKEEMTAFVFELRPQPLGSLPMTPFVALGYLGVFLLSVL